MDKCPNCKKESLDFDFRTKAAQCVWISDCGYFTKLSNYDEYVKRHRQTDTNVAGKLADPLARY